VILSNITGSFLPSLFSTYIWFVCLVYCLIIEPTNHPHLGAYLLPHLHEVILFHKLFFN